MTKRDCRSSSAAMKTSPGAWRERWMHRFERKCPISSFFSAPRACTTSFDRSSRVTPIAPDSLGTRL
jgi:hypothetical protein